MRCCFPNSLPCVLALITLVLSGTLAALIGSNLLSNDSAWLVLGSSVLLGLLMFAQQMRRVGMAQSQHADTLIAENHRLLDLVDERDGKLAMLRLLESSVVHARDAVVILEAEPHQGPGRSVLYANQAFSQMSGYTIEEVLGRSLHFLRGPGSDPATLDELRKALNSGCAFKGELLNYRKDGTEYWAELSVVPVPDVNGLPVHWVMMQRDISARKHHEEQLRQQDRLLRAIIDAFPGNLNAKDREGRYLLMNRVQAAYYGIEPEEAVGKNIAELPSLVSNEQIRNRDAFVLHSGQPVQFEERLLEADGRTYDWLVNKVPLPGKPTSNGEAEIAGVVTVYVDITEMKKIQENLRESQAFLADAQRIAQLGSWELDAGTYQFFWSDELYRILGIEPESVVASLDSFRSMVHPDDQESLFGEIGAVIAQPGTGIFEYRIIRPNGDVRNFYTEFYSVPQHEQDGLHFRGITQDITDRRQAEQKFFQAQKMELVGQMAGGIAHDFNNLLTAIIGNLNLVECPADSPHFKHIETALRASNRAADLTQKLLGFARKNQLSVAPVLVRDLVNEAYEFISRTFDSKIHLVVDVQTQKYVSVDLTLMSQVLLNLCVNARDAMPNGGTLTIHAEEVEFLEAPEHADGRAGAFIQLVVEDTGIGIPAEALARIFEPFFTTKPVGKGTGLGLAMVLGTMAQHKGWVVCDSQECCGTRFELYLPFLVPSETPQKSGPVAWTVQNRSLDRTPPPRPLKPATILLVDDEEMIRSIGREVLEGAGMKVLEATDGDEAIEIFRIQGDTIDLVVLDLTMPRVSGREACRSIREMRASTRVLFSSGYSAEDVEAKDGALGLLTKPYRPQELLEVISRALSTGK